MHHGFLNIFDDANIDNSRIGIFAFGLEEPNGVNIAAGIVVAGWGVLTVGLAFLVGLLVFRLYFLLLSICLGSQVTGFFPEKVKYIP